MNKRFYLFSAILISMMMRPVFALADMGIDVQREVMQLQTDMIEMKQQHLDFEEQALQKAEVHVEQQEPAPIMGGPSFKVNQIVLVGNTIFSTEELGQYVKRYEGQVLYFKDLQDLARLITTHYVLAGYITCRAFIPPQRIYDGKVIIRIVEGRVGRIAITGNRWFSDHLYFDKLNVEPGQFFDIQQLALSLQDTNQLPDRFVKAYIQPGEETGTSDIRIVAQDQNPLHVSYEYNTRGTQLTHYSRSIVHVTDNNLTGHGDSLQTSLSFADQNSLLGATFQYLLRNPKEGLTYSFNGGYDYNRLEKYLRPLKVTSRSFVLSPGVTKNFIKTRWVNVDGFVGFEVKDSKVLVDQNKFSYDRSRVLDMGPRIAVDDNWGKTFIAGDVRTGIPILNGGKRHDPESSRIDSGGEFVYLTSSIDRINRLPYGSYLVLHAGGQYSPTPLTSLEQFYLGGMYSVRGYSENDSSGDSGLNFSAELRIPPYFIPPEWHIFNSKDKTWRDTFSFVTFVDGGRVFNLKQQPGSTISKDRTLLGTGAGLRYYVSPDLNCEAGIGFPFGDKSSDGKNVEPYISARVGF